MFYFRKRQGDMKNVFNMLKWHCGEGRRVFYVIPEQHLLTLAQY